VKVYVDANPTTIAIVTEYGGRYLEDIDGAGLTSNQAEYYAITKALDNPEATEILSDSQLAISQLNGKYAIRDQKMKRSVMVIWELIKDREVKFTWIPRKENLAGRILG